MASAKRTWDNLNAVAAVLLVFMWEHREMGGHMFPVPKEMSELLQKDLVFVTMNDQGETWHVTERGRQVIEAGKKSEVGESPIPSKSNVEADLTRKQQISTSTGVSIENGMSANENAKSVTVAAAYKNELWKHGELHFMTIRISEIEPYAATELGDMYRLWHGKGYADKAYGHVMLTYTPPAGADALRARVRDLEAALLPFANMVTEYRKAVQEEYERTQDMESVTELMDYVCGVSDVSVSADDFYRAYEVLEGEAENGEHE